MKKYRHQFVTALCFFVLVLVGGCAPSSTVNPISSFPTPTPFPLELVTIDEQNLEEMLDNVEEDDFVLQATVEPVDLDALVEDEEDLELQEIQAKLQKEITIQVDAQANIQPISDLIYGVANPPGIYLRTLQPSLSSWGGEGAVRFNWEDGNSWNLGSTNTYRNTPVSDEVDGNQALIFLENAALAEAETYMVLPTIGWVAKDNDPLTCSFNSSEGTCTTGNASTCQSNDVVANPNQTSIPVTPADILEFAMLLSEQDAAPKILSLLHEPELWGVTHYDLHPECTTYQEIADTFILYAETIKAELPAVELSGPGTCCWFYYWNSAAGEADRRLNDNEEFLPWFLSRLQEHENETGVRLLDILDIHYFPESVSVDSDDGLQDEVRLRATRSLWDPTYVDESFIREPVYLIPRMQELIDTRYPGTKFAISEWNFGGENTQNGALAIADVLGIYGREGVYMASYWTYPSFRSPGFWAFKMYTNYNNLGGKFGDISVQAESNDIDLVSSYAAVDSETGNLHLMIINKIDGFENKEIGIEIDNYDFADRFTIYQYTGEFGNDGDGINSATEVSITRYFNLSLPPNSITHLVFQPEQN
ncbi:MAG: glycoside hydrolase family 44 protein [Ardenticatenaceae bacterium]|nr:glycoside hydrolase family 44 protein [Ardenticatenaceae bacterium]